MDVLKGSLVYSKAGRDKGKLFLVLAEDAGFAYLADGDTRRVIKPKKKKLKHINATNFVADIDFDTLSDSVVRKVLSDYSAR